MDQNQMYQRWGGEMMDHDQERLRGHRLDCKREPDGIKNVQSSQNRLKQCSELCRSMLTRASDFSPQELITTLQCTSEPTNLRNKVCDLNSALLWLRMGQS